MNSSMFKGSMVAPVMCLLLLCHACHNDLAFFLLKWNIDHQKSNAVDLVIFWTFMMTGGWREVNLNSLQWDCPKNTKLIISSLIILCGLDLVTISLIDLGICHCKTVVMVSVQLVQNEICQSISSLFFVSRFVLFHCLSLYTCFFFISLMFSNILSFKCVIYVNWLWSFSVWLQIRLQKTSCFIVLILDSIWLQSLTNKANFCCFEIRLIYVHSVSEVFTVYFYYFSISLYF